jgi:glycerophosphoryl diester phosphodiesterase
MDNFIIVAHRGGHGPYNENTLEAFKHAICKGCKAVEMDLRFDHLRKRFYLEHDFLHSPRHRHNLAEIIVPELPPETFFFVELKTVAWLTKSYARNFLKEFKKLFKTENSVVMSFNPFVLMQLRKLEPGIKRGYLMGNFFWSFVFKKILHKAISPHILLLHKRLFDLNNVRFARSRGMKVMSFVLNDRENWQKAVDYGIDGIITDRFAELADFLKQRVL